MARKPKLTIVCLAETISLPQVRGQQEPLCFLLPQGEKGTLSLLLFLLLSMSLEFSTLVLILTWWECSSGAFVKGCQIRDTTKGKIR